MHPNATGLIYKSDLPSWFIYGFRNSRCLRGAFFYSDQFNIKDQRAEWRNIRSGPLFAVCQFIRYVNAIMRSRRHQLQALLPARDNPPQFKRYRFTAVIGAIKDLTVTQLAAVMYGHGVRGCRLFSRSFPDHFILQSGCRRLYAFA